MSKHFPGTQTERPGLRTKIRKSMVSGFAIAVPLLVTLFVFQFAAGFLLDALDPIGNLVGNIDGISGERAEQIAAVVLLLGGIFVVGFVTETSRAAGRLEDSFDSMMSSIPGLGSVYSSFNEMSQLLIDSETESFQEVKLVEFPVEGSYSVAFVTADTPSNIRDAADHPDMTTLYLPMAPNPVMGGHVVHISDEKVYDVDMTVEEGIQSIVTSGIAVGETSDGNSAQVQKVVDSTENIHLPEESEDTAKGS